MQFRFESIIPVIVLSFVLIGLPAVILKQATIWFVRTARDWPRLRLLGLSIAACAASGVATIVLHAALSGGFEFDDYPIFHAIPMIEAGTAAALLVLVGAVDGLLWGRFVETYGAQSPRAAALWLVGGNAWIPWALLLMHFWRDNSGLLD